MMRWLVLGLLAAALFTPRVASADPNEAEQLYRAGQAAFDARQYDDAITAWERSFALSAEPGLLFDIAQAYRLRGKPGDCTKATDAYRRFVTLGAASELRPVAEKLVADLKDCVAREAASSAPSPVAMTPPPAVAPAPPPRPERAAESARASPQPRPTLAVSAAPRGGRTRMIEKSTGLAAAGAGLALVAAGLYYGDRAKTLGNQVRDACANGCDWAVYGKQDAEGRSAERRQWICDGAGAAAIVSGAVLLWLGMREPAARSLAVARSDDGAVITWSGAW